MGKKKMACEPEERGKDGGAYRHSFDVPHQILVQAPIGQITDCWQVWLISRFRRRDLTRVIWDRICNETANYAGWSHLRSGSNADDFNHEGSGRDESLKVLEAFVIAWGEEESKKEIIPRVVKCLKSVAEIATDITTFDHVPISGSIRFTGWAERAVFSGSQAGLLQRLVYTPKLPHICKSYNDYNTSRKILPWLLELISY